MRPDFEMNLMLLLLIGYSYTLINAHIFLARIDRKENIRRHPCGEIRLKDIKAMLQENVQSIDFELRKAILLLQINRATVYMFFFILGFELLSRYSPAIINLTFLQR